MPEWKPGLRKKITENMIDIQDRYLNIQLSIVSNTSYTKRTFHTPLIIFLCVPIVEIKIGIYRIIQSNCNVNKSEN